jgi:hypothetical protein
VTHRRRILPCAAALALLAGTVTSACGQGTFDLTRKDLDGRDRSLYLGEFTFTWERGFSQLDEVPEKLKAQVKALGDDVLFFDVELGGRKIVMAVGRQEWPLLLADLDGDGELSDQEPIKASSKGEAPWLGGSECGFPMQTVTQPDAEAASKFSLKCMFPSEGPAWIAVTPYTVFTGTVTLGGADYPVILVDATLDGHLDDTHPGDPCDKLIIDFNRNGVFRRWDEQIPLPKLTRIGGVICSIKVADDNSTITFTEVDVPTGTLEAPTTLVAMTATSKDGVFRLEPGSGTWALPPGEYRLDAGSISAADDDGRELMAAIWDWKENDTVTIRTGETTELAIGPPLQLVIQTQREGETVSVNYGVVGQGGRSYSDRIRTKQGPVEAAKITISDEKGNELASGKFEYG